MALVLLTALATLLAAAPPASAQSTAAPPVPVVTATAERRDVPVTLSGIGTVTPVNSVRLTSQVTGVLQSVAFTEGQDVKVGDLVAEIDPRPFQAQLDEATAQLAKDQAALANARQILAEFQKLPSSEVISVQTVANQQSQVDEFAAAVAVDEAAVAFARVQLGYTRIASPVAGRTGFRLVDPGNLIPANDATGIVVVNQIDPIEVVFTLPEDAVATVAAASAAAPGAPLPVEAFARGASEPTARGTLMLVDNAIDPASGTVKLKALFPNPQGTLWPGQYVTAAVVLATERDAVVVPDAALQRGPAGLYVYVVEPSGAAAMRPVTTGPREGGVAVVRDGIAAGERVVVSGQYRLRPGAAVVEAPTAPRPSASGG